uniref:Uncharacterized protein n=1 Tax=biofilter metagenome TaxID=1070537 RepID=A0A1A7GE81_9ZZZZ
MSLKITAPVSLGAHNLVGTDVPEVDYAVWASAATYALGDRCIKDNAIWECAQDGNLNHSPSADDTDWWLFVSATNRWKAFDLDQFDWTEKATSFYYEFTPGIVTAAHLVGLRDASSVRIRLTDPVAGLVFDSLNQPVGRLMTEVGWWAWGHGTRRMVDQVHMYNLPAYSAATLRIDLAGGANLGVQSVVAGTVKAFGRGVHQGARLGIDSYSKTGRDKWGTAKLKKGAYSKRVNFTVTIHANELDELTDFLVESDARVQIWNVSDRWRSTKLLGFTKSWEQTISSYAYTDVSFELEGVAANG